MRHFVGTELESSTAVLTIAQIDYAQLLSSSVLEDQCPEKPFDAVNGGNLVLSEINYVDHRCLHALYY